MSDAAIVTDRLVLRPWREEDAAPLFRWASDPGIGPAAGWAPHASEEESRAIIRGILSAPETYAICMRDDPASPVGSVALKIGAAATAELALSSCEAELGYWIARPCWGRGYMGEAVRVLLAHGFDDLRLDAVWGMHYVGNERSRRVMERCGLAYVRTLEGMTHPVSGEEVSEDVRRITREEWAKRGRARICERKCGPGPR